jgi:hypothetical protein
MRHQWITTPANIIRYKRRRCKICGAEQQYTITSHSIMTGSVWRWYPSIGRCKSSPVGERKTE